MQSGAVDTNLVLNISGLALSVVGTILTIVTLRTAKVIQKSLLRKKRTPQLLEVLIQKNRALNAQLDSNVEFMDREMKILLEEIKVMLSDIYQIHDSASIRDTHLFCKKLLKKGVQQDLSVELLYAKVGGVITILENVIKDLEFEI